MKLKDYLEQNNISQNTFARMCGLSFSAINKLINRNTDLFLSTALKVEKATNGEITVYDLDKRSIDDTH